MKERIEVTAGYNLESSADTCCTGGICMLEDRQGVSNLSDGGLENDKIVLKNIFVIRAEPLKRRVRVLLD